MLDQLETLLAFALIMLLLSLIIMTIVQAINATVQRRGYNLLWGIHVILQQMGVDEANAKKLASAIAKHPAVGSDGWLCKIPILGNLFVMATAIRADELGRMLREVLPTVPGGPGLPWYQPTLEAADALERSLTNRGPTFDTLSAVLQALGPKLGERLKALGAADDPVKAQAAMQAALNEQAVAGAGTIQEALQGLTTRFAAQLGAGAPPAATIQHALNALFQDEFSRVRQKAADLKAWFDIVMDRSTERFTRWSSGVTIIASFVFCFVYQINGIDIMKSLYADKQLRAALVAQVDPTLKQADELISQANTNLASKTLRELKEEVKKAGYTGEVPLDLDTRVKGAKWINDNIKDASKREVLLAAYDTKIEEVIGKHVDQLAKTRKELFQKLDGSQLQLFPSEFDPRQWWADIDPRKNPHHFGGIVLAACLLSLGAPFWFSMLKGLANLRPVIAGKVDRQTEEQRRAS